MIKMQRSIKAIGVFAAASAAMIAAPLAAQSASGQIGLRGFVSSRCGVGAVSGTMTSDLSGTISLGELSDPEGHLRAALLNSTSGSPAGTIAFQAGCTGTASSVTLAATRFSTTSPVMGDGSGTITTSNDIDYTAQVAMALSGGGITTLNYTTAPTLPAPSSLAVTESFAFVPGNFEIRVFGLIPEGGNQSILVAGNYDATITVTITPA